VATLLEEALVTVHENRITLFDTKFVFPEIVGNKACSGRLGFCGIFKHFSGFEFFLLPSRVHARPAAANAIR